MLNCYIKAYFISSNLMEKYPFIHPPIDRVLLGELSKVNFGGKGKKFSKFKEVGWSNFEDKQYFEVIALIRESLLGTPMWKIEAYWSGHQS